MNALKTSSSEALPPLIPMMVPRRPTGTEKFSLTFTTRSNRRNSASRSGTTPCCCSNGWKEESMYSTERAPPHTGNRVCWWRHGLMQPTLSADFSYSLSHPLEEPSPEWWHYRHATMQAWDNSCPVFSKENSNFQFPTDTYSVQQMGLHRYSYFLIILSLLKKKSK